MLINTNITYLLNKLCEYDPNTIIVNLNQYKSYRIRVVFMNSVKIYQPYIKDGNGVGLTMKRNYFFSFSNAILMHYK